MLRSIRTTSSEDACVKATWVVRVFGILPMNEHFRLEPRLVAVSSTIMTGLLANAAYWMSSGYITMEGLFHHILYLARKVAETLCVIVIMVQLLIKRDRFRSIVYNLKTVECSLAEVGQSWAWSMQPKFYLRLPILTLILVILPLSVLNNFYWIIMHAEIWFIGAYVSYVCTFYDMLKHTLNQIRTTEECTSHTKLYNLVESSCEDLNAINGIGIFMVIVSYFLNLLHQVYQLLNLDNIPWNRFVEVCCSATYYGSFIMWIIFTCNGVSSEAKCFNNSLYRKVAHNNFENKNYDDIMFHFDMKKGLQFEANGFFCVNNSLICSMVIASTTYLVILLQWSPRMTAVII